MSLFPLFPIYLPWSDGTRCLDLSFLNVQIINGIIQQKVQLKIIIKVEGKKAEITSSYHLISVLSNSTWNKIFGLLHCFLIYSGSMHSLSFLLSSILGKQGMFSLIHWSYIPWLPIVHNGERGWYSLQNTEMITVPSTDKNSRNISWFFNKWQLPHDRELRRQWFYIQKKILYRFYIHKTFIV